MYVSILGSDAMYSPVGRLLDDQPRRKHGTFPVPFPFRLDANCPVPFRHNGSRKTDDGIPSR